MTSLEPVHTNKSKNVRYSLSSKFKPSQRSTKDVNFYLNKFSDIPTRVIRVKAAVFGLEKCLRPETNFRKRVDTKRIFEEISNKGIGTSERTVFAERTWRSWLSGDLKRPNLLHSFCNQIAPDQWPEKFLELDKRESPVLLLLHSLDVLLLDPQCKRTSLLAKKKIELARNVLNKLESKWTVNSTFNQLYIPESWLHPSDKNRIMTSGDYLDRMRIKEKWSEKLRKKGHASSLDERIGIYINESLFFPTKFGTCLSLPSASIHRDRYEFVLNKDVCDRFELEAPLKFLQFMLRMSLYLEENSEFPISTYSLDLVTAMVATYIFYNWYDDGISRRLSSGSILEAMDASLKFLCFGNRYVAAHLIHTTAPWGGLEKFSEDKIIDNLTAIRRAYMYALHEFGITQISIKKLIIDVENTLKFSKR